jgi:hypothetical protein
MASWAEQGSSFGLETAYRARRPILDVTEPRGVNTCERVSPVPVGSSRLAGEGARPTKSALRCGRRLLALEIPLCMSPTVEEK